MRNRFPNRRAGRRAPVAETIERRTYLSVSITSSAAATPAPLTVLASELATPDGYSTPTGAPISPAKMRGAYGLGTVGSSPITFGGLQGDGSGQTIAIVGSGDYPTAATDLAAFDTYWGLPAPPSFQKLNASGQASPLPATGNAGEAALDVEWAHVMAPGASIIVFEGSLYTAMTTAKSWPGVAVISISYNISGNQSTSFFYSASGHTGVTFLGASGDKSTDINEPGQSPSVISVGGTALTVSGTTYSSETTWSSAGGGIATEETQPTYQKIKAAPYSTQYRTTPDVSMDASPSTGVAVYDTTDNAAATPWTAVVGGTSLSTPLWAGIVAVADQGRVAAGLTAMDGYTQTLPRLYTLPSTAFHDVTSGSNANPAKVGYDLATGLGSPVAGKLIPDLAGADTISGRAFVDANGDGTYDAGDTVLANQSVYVDLNGNGALDTADLTATTNANGQYTFTDVIGGITCTVRLATTPAGYLHTTTAAVTTAYDASQTVDIGIERSPYGAVATPSTVITKTTALSVTGTAPSIASTFAFTWAATSVPSGGAATFGPNGTYAARSSTATFTKAGSYTFTLTVSDGQGGSATMTVAVTVAATASAVTVSPVTASLNSGQIKQLTASLVDQFGDAVAPQPTFAWTIDSGDGSVSTTGLYTAPSDDGTVAVVRATAGSFSGTSTVNVLSGGFAAVDVGSPSPTGTSADEDGTFTVAGAGTGIGGTADQFRFVYQTLPGDGSIIARVATQQYTAAGAIAGVTIRQSLSANSVGALMAVTPGDGLTFVTRATAGATATTRYTTANVAPYWVKLVRSGSILGGYYSPNGVTWTAAFSVLISMTSPAYVGLAVSSATSGTLSTATFDHVSVSPTVFTAAAASPNPVTGTTTTLSVLGYDDNGESNLKYTWVATALPAGAATPSLSDNGTNSAKSITATFSRAGTYGIKVTITDAAGLTATTTATVTVTPTLASIAVTPATASVAARQSAQFTAIARDQFGNGLALQPTIAWTLTDGSVGTISSTGLYAAPSDTGGSATVIATAGSVSGTASVTVPAPPPPDGGSTSASTPTAPSDAADGWTSADVGGPSLAGSGTELDDIYTVAGSGTGLGATTDQFQYLYQTVTGNGAIVARVAAQAGTSTGGFAGVAIRQSLAAGSAGVVMGVTPSSGLMFASRATTGGTQTTRYTTANVAPYWVKLVRSGSVVGGYYSANGVTWTAAFAVIVALSDPITVGLASSSGSNAALATDTFDNVVVGLTGAANNNPTGAGPTVAVGASASPNPVTGTTATLWTLGADASGEAGLTYTWAATTLPTGATAPTFSANKTNGAKTTTATFTSAGTYAFKVTIADGAGRTVTSTINVTVAQTVGRVAVTPATTTLVNAGDAKQLIATAYDQFGKALTAAPSFVWSLSAGTGAVSALGGLFTAGAAGSTATVRAAVGTVAGTAALTVAARPFTVFDNLTYTGAPAAAAYGLTQATVMYDGYIWPKGDTTSLYNQTDGKYAALPDKATFQQSVLYHIGLQGGSVTASSAVILDIESIALSSGTTAQVTQNFNVLITLAQWTKEVAPHAVVGYYCTSGYGILPTVWGSAYQTLATQLGATVDAFFPSMYLHSASTTHTAWASMETTDVAQAKALAPGKPVYFYLWPQQDYGSNAYMSASEWTYELTQSRTSGGAGVVMWSGSSTAFDATKPYWPATLSFVAGIANPVIGSLSTSAASVTAGASVNLSANTVVDAGSTVSTVTFYLETDGSAGLGATTDRAIGTAVKSGTNWSASFSTVGLSAGTYTIYAVATDAAGIKSWTGVAASAVSLVVV